MQESLNIISADIAVAREVARVLKAVLAVPAGPLEHAIQIAHESTAYQKDDPPETFLCEGLSRQALRMFWHFRCNLTAIMPKERR